MVFNETGEMYCLLRVWT